MASMQVWMRVNLARFVPVTMSVDQARLPE
jgi:hypothetical protein